ncbi:lysis system i-spanin subunit Rz [Variovorax sp. OK605]|uniref:lysis system i-spanin subunit Rz n=1 Tax=Variovorax sp. OK605 TaxID=1855317 RepID=UPI000B8A52C8|nr:lysis system i-spanin subunit Rz [Variovorax sp. OK605]
MSWLKALLYLLAVAICAAWTGLAYHLGAESRGAAVRLEWQSERAANARAVVNALERTLDAQQALAEGLVARDAAHSKEIERVQGEKALLEHRLSSGGVRVSVPARAPACRPAGDEGASAAGQPEEARAELDPAFAAAVAGITGDGDAAIVDLNACIDRYNEVRGQFNALTGSARAQTP